MKILILLLSAGLLLASCAHNNDVRAGSDGTHMIRTTFAEADLEQAARQADRYCLNENGNAVFLNGNPNFKADMDQKKAVASADQISIMFKCEKKKTLFDRIEKEGLKKALSTSPNSN